MSSGGEALSEALNKINFRWVAVIAVLIVLLLAIRSLLAPTLAVEVGMTAPEFALESTDEKIITLGQLHGVPVILSFWALDCEDCIAELPDKSAFAKDHREFEFLGIAVGSASLDELADAQYEHDISFPVLESDLAVEKSYGLTDLPVTILIDDQGIIRRIQEGKISKARLGIWAR